MANGEISSGKIIAGICIAVVTGVIFWLCSSTISYGNRLSVMESSYTHIQQNLCELKDMVRELIDESRQSP